MNQHIRKYLLLAACTLFLASCSTNGEIPAGHGKVEFHIGQNTSISVKSQVSEAPGSFIVSTTDSQERVVEDLSGQYADFKQQEVIVPVGTYFIEAYNITPEQAEQGRGAQRFWGSKRLDVTSSNVSFADFSCAMANARVSFAFDDTFRSIYDMESSANPVKIVACTSKNPERKIEFNKNSTLEENNSQVAYFNADEENTVLNFTITARRKSDSQDKTFTKTIEIKPQNWYRITLKANTL